MKNSKTLHHRVGFATIGLMLAMLGTACAAEPQEVAGLSEATDGPVYRVSKQESLESQAVQSTQTTSVAIAVPKPHPLDPALAMARTALHHSRTNIADYTAIVVKRERVGNVVGEQQYMFAKVRNEKREGDQVITPFSVYLKFLKPSSLKGREVIYVKGENNGKLIAHEGGFKGRFTPAIYLDPEGMLAMRGQRYPVTELGLERLCEKLLERGGQDRSGGEHCEVITQPAKINNRSANRIEILHGDPEACADFHVARIFVDEELGCPVRYEAYGWPSEEGGNVTQADLIEEYTYLQVKLNVGLTDMDFDPANTDYNME